MCSFHLVFINGIFKRSTKLTIVTTKVCSCALEPGNADLVVVFLTYSATHADIDYCQQVTKL